MQPDITDVTARSAKLVGDYIRAEGVIKGTVADLTDSTARKRRLISFRVNAVLHELGSQRGPKMAGLVKLAYARGLHLVNPKMRIDENGENSIHVLTESLIGRLVVAESAASSNVHDAIKRTILSSVAAEMGRKNMGDVVALLDRRGARWDLAPYAQTAIRTVAHEALTEGTLAGMQAEGLDMIHVSHKSPVTNALCKLYDNKIFSLGGTKGPRLTKFPPFHPNCEHFIYPAVTS